MDITAEVRGVREAIERLKKVEQSLYGEIDKVVFDAAKIYRDELIKVLEEKRFRLTGEMIENVDIEIKTQIRDTKALIKIKKFYSTFLEKGTKHIAAFKMTEVAWERCKERVNKMMVERLGRVVNG